MEYVREIGNGKDGLFYLNASFVYSLADAADEFVGWEEVAGCEWEG